MRKRLATAVLALVFSANAQAEAGPVNSGDIKWGPAPAVFPAGAQIAVMAGDPSKPGLFVIRFKMPANYRIPAHNHPTAEYVTVLSGMFHIGMGDKLDPTHAAALGPGGFGEAPPKMNHFAWASQDTIVQVHGEGPFVINYVDPKDDPTKR